MQRGEEIRSGRKREPNSVTGRHPTFDQSPSVAAGTTLQLGVSERANRGPFGVHRGRAQ